jgi:hypothetical protein
VAESVQLQRVGLARQRTISLVCRRGHTGLLRSDRVSGVEVFLTTSACLPTSLGTMSANSVLSAAV